MATLKLNGVDVNFDDELVNEITCQFRNHAIHAIISRSETRDEALATLLAALEGVMLGTMHTIQTVFRGTDEDAVEACRAAVDNAADALPTMVVVTAGDLEKRH